MGVLLRKETIGNRLGISTATVNNWIKTRVIPAPERGGLYPEEIAEQIIASIKVNPLRLTSRANRVLQSKKHVCYSGIAGRKRRSLLDSIVSDFENSSLSAEEGVLALAFALLRSNKLIDADWKVNARTRLDSMLSAWLEKCPAKGEPSQVQNFYADYTIENLDDDFLGAFYQSTQSVCQRSKCGAYYTPFSLLEGIAAEKDKSVLDPCCGSGAILLKVLTKGHDASKVYAQDIDETALRACFINLALFFGDKDMGAHVSRRDISALPEGGGGFDLVVTNPPWGSRFTEQQKEALVRRYPELATGEIFSIALYNGLKQLNPHGRLYYFMPHSFLNTAAHRNIRRHVFCGDDAVSLRLLGSAFRGVASESVLLLVQKGVKNDAIEVNRAWRLPKASVTAPDFIVSAACKVQDISILNKIYAAEHLSLKDNAIFALGIVTGNNKKFLLPVKTKNSEAIFRGRDVQKYSLSEPQRYLEFSPGLYQQAAPLEYYRQKKVVYRFIGCRIVCALDTKNSLLLNSANLIIPGNYPMETLVALFNSGIYTFIFQKKFRSNKVLKSHLQELPLPVFSGGVHGHIFELHKSACEKAGLLQVQAEIDRIICEYFAITDEEYKYIESDDNNVISPSHFAGK
jgi:SAM-dependent methyltransferase